MSRTCMLSLVLLAACASEPALRPSPGVWKPDEHRNEDVLAREFGMVRILLAEPKFSEKSNTVAVRFWVENRTNDLILMDSTDLRLIEPGGRACKNEAKSEKREVSGVYPELVVGEFAPTSPRRCREEGFTLRFHVTPYAPVEGAPFPIEIVLRPN